MYNSKKLVFLLCLIFIPIIVVACSKSVGLKLPDYKTIKYCYSKNQLDFNNYRELKTEQKERIKQLFLKMEQTEYMFYEKPDIMLAGFKSDDENIKDEY